MKVSENMEKIKNIQELSDCLKANLIVCTPTTKGLTFIVAYKDGVRIQNDRSRYTLSFQDFIELYADQTFYIYENKQEEGVNTEKDEEYYGWYHK